MGSQRAVAHNDLGASLTDKALDHVGILEVDLDKLTPSALRTCSLGDGVVGSLDKSGAAIAYRERHLAVKGNLHAIGQAAEHVPELNRGGRRIGGHVAKKDLGLPRCLAVIVVGGGGARQSLCNVRAGIRRVVGARAFAFWAMGRIRRGNLRRVLDSTNG